MSAAEFLCAGRCTGGAGDKLDRITFALHAVHEVLAPRAHTNDRSTYHRELASIICGSMLLVHFALGAVALRTIRPDEEYDPARTQSNRTIRIHEIGLRVLQNEGKFELVGSVHNDVRDTGLPV